MKKQTAKQEVSVDAVIKKDVNKYVEMATAITVSSEEEYQAATEVLLKVKEAEKRAEEEKNKVLKPLNEAVKAERNRWKPLEDTFKKVNDLIRPKMLAFVNAKEAKAKADLEALNKKIAAGQIKKEETIARKEEEILSNVPAKTVHTGSGSSSLRKVKTLNVVDEALIPDKYWVIDMVKLREDALKKDIVVPGTTVTFENSLAII